MSWWTGEGTGTDATGNNPGSLGNGLWFANGEVGQAFNYDGADDYFFVPASSTMNVGTGPGFTIECWILPSDLSDQHAIAEWNDGAGNIGSHLYISIADLGGLGSIYANVVDSTGNNHQFASSAGLLNTSSFQHIALTYDRAAGTAKIYYNGAVVAAHGFGSFTPQTSYGFYLGARPSGESAVGSYFAGLMDEPSIYSRALSDSEVLAIYDAGSAGKCGANPPVIVNQPTGRQVRTGANTTFTVKASGLSLQYRWQFGNQDVPGATSSSLTLTNVHTSDAGDYSVIVSNVYGTIVSSPAPLVVDDTCVSAPSGLVSWWPAENNAIDAVAANNGTLQGGIGFAAGEAGQGFNFDGTNDYVSIPASASLDVGSNSGMTVDCWIKPTELGQHAIIEWDNGSGGIGVHFWFSVTGLGGPGSLLVNMKDISGADHLLSSGQNILTTNFQHVAFSYNKSNGVAKIYRNGLLAGSQIVGAIRPQTTFPLNLGARVVSAGPVSFYQGLMDEVTLYGRALTDSEVQSIFLAGSAGKACIAPEILAQPSSFRVKPGTNIAFSVAARGTAPIGYQWLRNGTVIDGATNTTLCLTNVQPSLSGIYAVRITNALGTVTSSDAVLKVDVILAFGNGFPLTNSPSGFAGSAIIQLQNVYTNGYIFYTLDGSSPSFFSTQYTGPFIITQPVILRALGYSVDFFQFGELDPISIYIQPPLALTITNKGGGTVSLSPPGGFYLSNTVVSATATPAAGWTFLQWLGDANGTGTQTFVTMTRSKMLKPVFGTSLSTTAAGGGSVVLNPSGDAYPYGTIVTLSAIPNPGNYFGIWGNAATGNANPLSFAVTNANSTISSLFSSIPSAHAGLAVIPVGNGAINVIPKANLYNVGQSVTISATPDAGQSFSGWSGDASGKQNPLTVSMNQDRTIYANFTHNALLSAKAGYEGVQPEGFVLTLSGDYARKYEFDGSTNLLNWTNLAVVTNSFGTFQFTDPARTNFNRRFYRAVLLP